MSNQPKAPDPVVPYDEVLEWKKDPTLKIYEPYVFYMRVLHNYWLAWCVAAVAIVAAVYLGLFRGEWRPTGDGRTVVHSRTGELRTVPDGPHPH